MANELRVRAGFAGGLVEDNPLSAAATTLSSAGLAAIPAISSTQHMAIILDPDGINGNPEIAYITGHVAAATTATILRGQESTVARAHDRDTPWVHGPTVLDFTMPTLLSNAVTVDVPITANVFADACTLSLPPGTWRIQGQASLTVGGGGAGWTTTKIWDGTTVYRSSTAYMLTDGGGVMHVLLPFDLVLAATTTIKLSGTSNVAASNIRAAAAINGTGTSGTLSVLTAQRIA